jgi:hypothetical protein
LVYFLFEFGEARLRNPPAARRYRHWCRNSCELVFDCPDEGDGVAAQRATVSAALDAVQAAIGAQLG